MIEGDKMTKKRSRVISHHKYPTSESGSRGETKDINKTVGALAAQGKSMSQPYLKLK